MILRWIALLVLIYGPTQVFSQVPGQIVRGTIVDHISRQPISFANIILADTIGAITDEDGKFRFENIPFGKYTLVVSFLGYEDIVLRNIYIDAGKEVIYNLKMEESTTTLEEIVVTASKDKSQPLNSMSLLSTRMMGVEETKKYASAFNDPARMANSFAGVVQTDAGSNHIAIRGNAPKGLLWRLEGVEIPNPNHFSAIGTAGGGVSILSGQLLANSDFSTGAFAAEYGNALSGVFDINLRKGNDENREYTIQAGILGIDLAAEGPVSGKGQNSYLVNYRYSTLGIISRLMDLGGFVTTFQDLSYNVSFKNEKLGDITFFGLNGLSSQVGRDSIFEYDLDFTANTLVNGLTHSKSLGNNTFLKSVFVYTHTTNKILAQEQDRITQKDYLAYDETHTNKRITLSSKIQHKLSSTVSLKTGIIHNLLWYQEYKAEQSSLESHQHVFYNQQGSTYTSQMYAQFLLKPHSRLTATAGTHFIYNWLNNTKSIEPRLAMQYALSPKQSINVGYGLHSQILPLGLHFVEVQNGDLPTFPNKKLSMSKAHHLVLGYNYKPNALFNIKLEAYYQELFNIPQGTGPENNISSINIYWDVPEIELVNEGKGRNYGVELTVEKYLHKGYYFNAATSVYSSKFGAPDGNWYHTRFDGGFASSITGGKEFSLSKRSNRTMGIHIKSIYTGGLRQSPIDYARSLQQNETVFDHSNPYSIQFPHFFRFDLKLSFKRNYKTTTSTLSFDIQNITNRENLGAYEFSPRSGEVEEFNHIGMLPVISYKLEF